MSIVLMSAAFKAQIKATPKLVLLALCDCANDQGECYPSVPALMEKCSSGERTVQEALQFLEREGYLSREFRAGRSTVYWITDPRKWREPVRPDQSHYVYRIDLLDGSYYIGLRTCIGRPEDDPYMGSGAGLPLRAMQGRKKSILQTYASRELAATGEYEWVRAAIADPLCINQRTPATPADSAPRSSRTPQQPHHTPADCAPPPPQIAHPTPAAAAPRTINEPSIEPSGKQKKAPTCVGSAVLVEAGFDEDTAAEFIAHKQRMKAPLTGRAWTDHLAEAKKAGWSPLNAAIKVMAKNWKGFEAKYVSTEKPQPGYQAPVTVPSDAAEKTARYLAEQAEHAKKATSPPDMTALKTKLATLRAA